MNSNLFHNILNVLMVVIAIFSLPEVSSLIPADLAVKIVGVAGTLKLVVNVIRDGFGGLAKAQPPVQ